MIKDNKQKNNFNAGFTLVETLVAISILMVAIVAPMTIVQNGLTAAGYAKQQMIADYLAQEALEYVKYHRDINGLKSPQSDWLAGLGPCLAPNYCKIDTVTNTVASAESVADPLYYNGTVYTYNQVGAEETVFTRKLTIENPSNSLNDQAKVTASVSWTGKNEGSLDLVYYILNYRQQ